MLVKPGAAQGWNRVADVADMDIAVMAPLLWRLQCLSIKPIILSSMVALVSLLSSHCRPEALPTQIPRASSSARRHPGRPLATASEPLGRVDPRGCRLSRARCRARCSTRSRRA